MAERADDWARAYLFAQLNRLHKRVDAGEAEEAWRDLQALQIPEQDDGRAAARLRQIKAHCAAKIADAARDKGDHGEALAWRRCAADLEPQSAGRGLALAWALLKANDFDAAWVLLTALQQRDLAPELADGVRKAMGSCALQKTRLAVVRKDEDEASVWLGAAAERIPESPFYQVALGWAHVRGQRFADAWDVFRRAGETARGCPEAASAIERGLAFVAREEALELEFRGHQRSIEGVDWASIVRWREEALHYDPSNLFNLQNYVCALIYCGRFTEAKEAMAAVRSPDLAADLYDKVGIMADVLRRQIEDGSSIFRTEAPRYRAREMPVVPARGKMAIPRDWDIWSDRLPSDDDYERWNRIPGANIGLVLGRQSGVSVVDIDTDDPEIIAVILAHLPVSPWRRVGRRGMALAYRWIDLPKQSFGIAQKGPLLDLLFGPDHVLLPPSLHPATGLPYTAARDLLDVLEELPELPKDIVATIAAALRAKGCDLREGRRWAP